MLTMLFHLLATAIRVEKKLDELLKLTVTSQKVETGQLPVQLQPLSNPTQGACPLCQRPIVYRQVMVPETDTRATVRSCGCKPPPSQQATQGE